MPALSRSTLLQLVGFNSNVIASELVGSSTFSAEVIFCQAVGRKVVSLTGSTLTFSGGDNSVFSVGQFLTFDDDQNLFQIVSIAATSVTLVNPPSIKIVGDDIRQSFTLDPATTFQLRATEYLSSGTSESRGILDLGTVSVKLPANNLILDTSVIPIDLTRSWVRIFLAANTFSSSIPPLGDTPNGSNYVIFAGFLSITQPANAITPLTNPSTVEIQRFVWLISSKLSV